MEKEERKIYLDYLRVMSTCAIILIHIAGQNWYALNVNGFEWIAFSIYNGLVRWGVPVFIMISGSLLLHKNLSISQIYSKYITRLMTAFLSWSLFYALYYGGDLKTIFLKIIYGNFHMWFLLMIGGIYICIPFIQVILKDNRLTNYYLVLSVIFVFIFPFCVKFSNDFLNSRTQKIMAALQSDISYMSMPFVGGFVFYFLLGYLLDNLVQTRRIVTKQVIIGVIGVCATIVLTILSSKRVQAPVEHYFDYINLNVMLESIGVFGLVKWLAQNTKPNRIITTLSQCSLGACMIHVVFIEFLHEKLAINTLSYNAILSVPVNGVAIICASYGVAFLLHSLPILRKIV